MTDIDLSKLGVTVKSIQHNAAPAALYEEAIRYEPDVAISNGGALIAYSGVKTGRSPTDKRVVKEAASEGNVWWGSVNIPIEKSTYQANWNRAVEYLNSRDKLYCVDGFAGWDVRYRIKVRVICARPYHALFMHNMLIRPSVEELAEFGDPDCVILNAGAYPADPRTAGMTSKTSINLCLSDTGVVILGTEYAGEMKKAVFTLMNYLMPAKNVLSMHCSATASQDGKSSSVLFGLSGTGKTTLSADPSRQLIGDDEHCWSDDGLFNIEGGCYAKAINLTREAEPQIYDSLRFGAVLENVIYDKSDRSVDFDNTSITENTRGCYPIDFVDNARIPCVATHPSDVIFLTCDAFGVLPPVSKLTPEQAEYHFISGYTAKVAGTEVGVTEPTATFSPCFGGPFLAWHPGRYAELLSEKIRRHGANVWLVNTGWTGGAYGTGSRIKLSLTRAIINAIHSGALADAKLQTDPIFRTQTVVECPGVPTQILTPRNTWADPNAFDEYARKLAGLFIENFKQFAEEATQGAREAGPAEG